ncbi:hypothetical protein I4U23_001079 [Adineta vaga]|nr:hypothetical protein I4U23_001079 [Adineta vaga]
MEYQQEQPFSTDEQTKSYFAFFDRFGQHDQVRARLNNDLKREYNEYLQSLHNMARRKAQQMNTPRGNVTRRVQFQQGQTIGGSQDQRKIHNAHSMNDISSSRGMQNSQSMSDVSSGTSIHNVHSMNDLSSTVTSELAGNRARARLVQQHSEQYIRDREEYILELYEQIYELEARIRQLETESRKLTVHNSTSETRARYTQDLNALNALLAERLNQRVAVDYELAQILERPPVPHTGGRVIVNGGTSNMTIPIKQMTPRPIDNLQIGQQTTRSTENFSTTTRRAPEPQQFQSPRTPRDPNRPPSPTYARGSIFNGIYGTFKTEEQVRRQERYRQDLLQQIEEKQLARRRAEEERERLKQLQYEQQLARQLAEEALRKQQEEEAERRRLLLLEEEAERKRREEELERQRQADEAERRRRQDELARQRNEDEAERLKKREEIERLRKEEDAERLRRRAEADRLRQIEDLERQRRKEEEEERRRREKDEDRKRREEEEERRRKLEEEEERRKREEEEERKRRLEEENEEERRRRKRLEEEEEEERRRRNIKVRIHSPSIPRETSESDVLRRLMQLKRQLRDKENRLRDTIQTDTTTTHTRIIDHSSPPYLPPPQPFYLQRRESSDDLLDVARIHYRDAPLTHDILLNILKTTEGDELNPSYIRDDSVIMRGIGEGKRITSAEFLTLPKPPGISDELFSSSIESLAGRRRYGNSLPAFYDNIDSLDMVDKELNRIAKKSDHRVSKLRHIELDDGQGFDAGDILERFEGKSRLQGVSSRATVHDDAWLK